MFNLVGMQRPFAHHTQCACLQAGLTVSIRVADIGERPVNGIYATGPRRHGNPELRVMENIARVFVIGAIDGVKVQPLAGGIVAHAEDHRLQAGCGCGYGFHILEAQGFFYQQFKADLFVQPQFQFKLGQ